MKRLLKKIFPILFLKRAFLVLNQIKILTWDKLIYKTYHLTKSEVILEEAKNPFLAIDVDISNFSENIRKGFSRWRDPEWKQDQYIVCVNQTISIDPETGWAVTSMNQLILPSLGFSGAPYVKKPGLRSMLFKRKNVQLKKIISLRDTGEENYFHFYNDVIAKIWFLQDHNMIDESEIVISEKLWLKPYFKFFYENTNLKQLRWYIQKDEWVTADHAIFCKPFTHAKKYWLKTCSFVLPFISNSSGSKRIFLTRSAASLRFIENDKEVENLLTSYKFQIVDASALAFLDQVNLFSHAEVIIAVHGAGISNILFRNGKPLRVLELFHPNQYLAFHYIMLCKMYDYKYDALQGSIGKLKGRGGFQMDPSALENYCLSLDSSNI